MIKLDESIQLVFKAGQEEPDWKHITDLVRASLPEENGPYNYSQVRQRIPEVFTMEQYRMAAQEAPFPVEIIDIPDGTETRNYIWKRELGTAWAINKKTGKSAAEIDGCIAIAKETKRGKRWQPFIVEVKLTKYGHFAEEKTYQRYTTKLTKLIEDPYSLKGIRPVLEYFRHTYGNGLNSCGPHDIGMIVAMPLDQFNPKFGGAQQRFLDQGGHIHKLHLPWPEYMHVIYAIAEQHNLNIKTA